jgi:hypothetical protein
VTDGKQRVAAKKVAFREALPVLGQAGDRTATQKSLVSLYTAIVLDPRVPPDVVARLGQIVVLSNQIGQGSP